MRVVHLLPAIALALLLAAPAVAGRRHQRDRGPEYSRSHRGSISIGVFGRLGGHGSRGYGSGGHYRAPSRGSYYEPRHDGRYRWKELKRREKHYKKRYRKSRHRGHHDYGPFCPRY